MVEAPLYEIESIQHDNLIPVSGPVRKRTYELIRKLSELKYEHDTGQVISACMKVLKKKRIKL